MTSETEQRNEFLRELTQLCKKHKFYIGGCGCCGSPSIEREAFEGANTVPEQDLFSEEAGYTIDVDGEYLEWQYPNGWKWEEKGRHIIK